MNPEGEFVNSGSHDLEAVSNLVRKRIFQLVYWRGSGHLGSSLSIADLLVSVFMRKICSHQGISRHNELILSKGHAAPALYVVLNMVGLLRKGDFEGFRRPTGKLQGHPESDLPGVSFPGGSLGPGLPFAVGVAWCKKKEPPVGDVYVIASDAECDSGVFWEGAFLAISLGVTNINLIVESNRIDDEVDNTYKSSDQIGSVLSSIGWNVTEIDGHDHEAIGRAFEEPANDVRRNPKAIIAKTVSGKGLTLAEGVSKFRMRPPNESELDKQAKQLLSGPKFWRHEQNGLNL